jgi:hypothetical protein
MALCAHGSHSVDGEDSVVGFEMHRACSGLCTFVSMIARALTISFVLCQALCESNKAVNMKDRETRLFGS